jgi:hypothetical protein
LNALNALPWQGSTLGDKVVKDCYT